MSKEKENTPDPKDRYRGALLGLACGDALGTTLEFTRPGTFQPITDIVGGGPFGLTAGKWTDDTSMALCLADSLIERKKFDAFDQMAKYLDWYRKGYNSCTGRCFDIGNATRIALEQFERTGESFCGDPSVSNAGNGSLMRLAPIPLFFARHPEKLLSRAAWSSKTTHAAPQCVDACVYYSELIAGALQGLPKDRLLDPAFSLLPAYWEENPMCEPVNEVRMGSYKSKEPPRIYGSGYVVRTLEAALWAFYRTDDFESGALQVVNLGDDADTTGAVYGQLAGAYYGVSGIPEKWLNKVYWTEMISEKADHLYELAQGHVL